MKKWLFILSVALATCALPACDNKSKSATETNDDIATSEVPQAVQSAFAAKYPGVTDVKWENATENNAKTYKAKFTQNGSKMKVEFGADGSFIKVD